MSTSRGGSPGEGGSNSRPRPKSAYSARVLVFDDDNVANTTGLSQPPAYTDYGAAATVAAAAPASSYHQRKTSFQTQHSHSLRGGGCGGGSACNGCGTSSPGGQSPCGGGGIAGGGFSHHHLLMQHHHHHHLLHHQAFPLQQLQNQMSSVSLGVAQEPVSSLVRMRNSTLGKSAPSLSASMVNQLKYLIIKHLILVFVVFLERTIGKS